MLRATEDVLFNCGINLATIWDFFLRDYRSVRPESLAQSTEKAGEVKRESVGGPDNKRAIY